MKTIRLNEPGHWEDLETTIEDDILSNEVLVKVHRIGICGTDYHAYRGKQPFFTYPRILGHELGVEVIKTGSEVTNVKPGDRCAVEPYLNCGKCDACKRGKTNCCENLKVLGVHTDGGMQELIKVPAHKLHTSEVLTFEQLALVETLGIGFHAVQRAGITPTDTVLVIGAGPIGLSVLEFVKVAGAKVVVLDMNENRLDFCINHHKADIALVNSENQIEKLKTVLDDNLPTIVFDATGNPDSMQKAYQYVANGGKLVFVGLFQGDFSFSDPDFHRRELTIMASRNSISADFRQIIKLIETKKVDVESWISERVPFSHLINRFDKLLTNKTLVKAIIEL
jgi:2-desacetyl-2-hydroxyethyl bacteriochlorophyllide A dehydrogenase